MSHMSHIIYVNNIFYFCQLILSFQKINNYMFILNNTVQIYKYIFMNILYFIPKTCVHIIIKY